MELKEVQVRIIEHKPQSHRLTGKSGEIGIVLPNHSAIQDVTKDGREIVGNGDHPRIRLTEKQLDLQMLAIFDTLRIEDNEFRNLFREQLR